MNDSFYKPVDISQAGQTQAEEILNAEPLPERYRVRTMTGGEIRQRDRTKNFRYEK